MSHMDMENVVLVLDLPNKGSHRTGSFEKKVQVRSINGYDQQSISTLPVHTPQPLKTTELLCRTARFETERINMERSIDSTEKLNKLKVVIRSLTIGNRTALLLHTWQATFGDALHLELMCSSCNQIVSCTIPITSLLISRNEKSHNSSMNIRYRGYDLKIRPVTGEDQEKLLLLQHSYQKNENKVSEHLGRNHNMEEERYSEFLVRNCIVNCTPQLPKRRLSLSFIRHISSKLEELDPQANILLKIQCPHCNNYIKDFFDIEDFMFKQLDLHGRGLYQEVNYLALFYHWTEDAILSLPIMKRKKYVDLIEKTLLDREEAHG